MIELIITNLSMLGRLTYLFIATDLFLKSSDEGGGKYLADFIKREVLVVEMLGNKCSAIEINT